MHTHKNIAVSVSEKIWIKCFVNSCCSNTWNVVAYSLTNPWLPRIVTRSSSVGQPRPTASRTGVPVRPRTPTPRPDHSGGLTSFSKCNALLVETDLPKRAFYNKVDSTAPHLSKQITKVFLSYNINRNVSILNPSPCILAESYPVHLIICYTGASPFSQHPHSISPCFSLLVYLYHLP